MLRNCDDADADSTVDGDGRGDEVHADLDRLRGDGAREGASEWRPPVRRLRRASASRAIQHEALAQLESMLQQPDRDASPPAPEEPADQGRMLQEVVRRLEDVTEYLGNEAERLSDEVSRLVQVVRRLTERRDELT